MSRGTRPGWEAAAHEQTGRLRGAGEIDSEGHSSAMRGVPGFHPSSLDASPQRGVTYGEWPPSSTARTVRAKTAARWFRDTPPAAADRQPRASNAGRTICSVASIRSIARGSCRSVNKGVSWSLCGQ